VRIAELQLGARKEGMDDLSLQLRISALCLPEEKATEPPKPSEPPREKTEND
jgi:hypothetical protein